MTKNRGIDTFRKLNIKSVFGKKDQRLFNLELKKDKYKTIVEEE